MKNLIQAAAITLLAASTVQAQQAVQWNVSEGGNGHWYRIVSLAGTGEVNWLTSRASALNAGGDLATFTSAAETAAFLSLTAGQVRGNPWIGLFQDSGAPDFSEPAGGWRWASGEDLVWTNWAPGEPNNAGLENWANMWIDNGPPGTWNDYRPTNPQGPDGYVIEWSADCNGDGIVDYGQCRDGSLPDYNGNNVPDCCESSTPCVVGNYPVQWRTAEGGNGHWYETVRPGSPITWLNARGIAHERGGYLASVTSLSEDDFVWSLASDPQNWNGSPGPWMGGRQLPGASEPASGWTWDSGEVFLWPSWQAGPNNLCGGINENSLHYFSPAGVTPQRIWNDFPGEDLCGPYPFPKALIIEWSADCNNDGIVDKGQILRGQLQDANADGVPDVCQQPTCRDADFFPDRNINGVDLGVLLSQWGPPTQYTVADLNLDGAVDGIDLGLFLSFWGPCPY